MNTITETHATTGQPLANSSQDEHSAEAAKSMTRKGKIKLLKRKILDLAHFTIQSSSVLMFDECGPVWGIKSQRTKPEASNSCSKDETLFSVARQHFRSTSVLEGGFLSVTQRAEDDCEADRHTKGFTEEALSEDSKLLSVSGDKRHSKPSFYGGKKAIICSYTNFQTKE